MKATPESAPAINADDRDIVVRLRDTPNWRYESYGSWKDCVSKYSRAPFEAADEIERLRAEVERLAAQSAPTVPVVTKDQRELIAKLRYMGKQYAAGQFARGGVPQKHYLEEAADEIEMMAWALNMNEKTPGSAQENADLRNVIQAACIDGIPGLERAWAKYFPGKPITVSPGAVAQSAPLAQQASGQQTQRVHQLLGSWNEAYPRMDIHSQPGTVVMFDGRGGYEIEQKSALKMLTLRGLYTVDHVDIGGTSSTVYLTGFTRGFNTCLFAQAPVDADRAAAQVEPRGTDAQILFERKLTCEAVQGAMAFGYQGKNPPPTDADHWLQPFWDIGNRTRQLEQAATLADFHRIMAMPEAEVDAELRSLGIDPDKAAERADRAIKGALAGAQVEPVRMLTEDELHECCGGCTSNAAIKTWMRRAVADFCLVNRGRVIPADGEVRK